MIFDNTVKKKRTANVNNRGNVITEDLVYDWYVTDNRLSHFNLVITRTRETSVGNFK